jgi:hypothetical protein
MACSGAEEVTEPTEGPAPTLAPVPTCPAPQPCPTAEAPVVEEGIDAPFEEAWAQSPHNDAESEAFVHWDESEDGMVQTACAACHSTTGYVDYLGGDGSEAGKIDNPVPIGTTVTCDACHNEAAASLSSVSFLSGVEITGLGPEARCMVCHQGRATKAQVDDQIARFDAEDPDRAVLPIQDGDNQVRFGFINVHYYAAAVTLYGGEVMGGYQYDGKTYDTKFGHVESFDTCVECHNPHTTEVRVEACAGCHEGVASVEDLRGIREVSSAPDYDGDGDVEEPILDEMAALRDTLYGAIVMYAKDLQGTGIVYDVAAHPYFFLDADNDGAPDTNEEGGNVAYNAWTPRLLKAAYNFQVANKDPGAYAHGNKYIIQLLYDSIEDLNARLPTPVDMTAMHRDDAGHFAGNTEAFRHWDAEEGQVPATCAKCHAAAGLPQFLQEGSNISVEASNGFLCTTCHDGANFPALYAIDEVTFPSGATVAFGEGDPNNLCLVCHQGRESAASVERTVGDLPADTPDEAIRFRNVHYFVAGATLFGSEVQGIYQYPNKEYAGRFAHVEGFDTCAACHDPHALEPKVEACAGCHTGQTPDQIRMSLTADYDGDGDTAEALKGELAGMSEKLYAAIQAYATDKSTGIVYDAHAHPYFFIDANGDGSADTNEEGGRVQYNAFTPKLLKAAYNYQYAQKDPGAYVHNFVYVAQALYDSIQDLGGDVTGMTRP